MLVAQISKLDGIHSNERGVSESRRHLTASPDQVKEALRRVPGAMTAISTKTSDGRFLATMATAVDVVTLDPPTMLVRINRESELGGAIGSSDRLAINILGSDQMDAAKACACTVSHEDREEVATWRERMPGAPELDGAGASVICACARCVAYGSHNLVFGEVIAVELNPSIPVDPLLYLNGKYCRSSPLVSEMANG